MRVITFEPLHTPPLPRSVIAVGVFDGVHLGHQALVAHAMHDAANRGLPCVVVTFDRDPDQVVSPDEAMPQLLSLEDKCAFLGETGVGTVLVVPFNAEVAAMSPERFVDDVLCAAVTPVAVHVGVDFRFGHFAEGDLSTLTALGAVRGFDVAGHDLVTLGDEPVTSTRIRRLVAEGDVTAAAALMSRRHRVSGRVVYGRGEGGPLLGIPTANIAPMRFAALPADGVYAGCARLGKESYPAGISVGVAPTFPEAQDVLEVHLLEFDGELHGVDLTVEFTERLRDQRVFDTPAALAESIRADLERARDGCRPVAADPDAGGTS